MGSHRSRHCVLSGRDSLTAQLRQVQGIDQKSNGTLVCFVKLKVSPLAMHSPDMCDYFGCMV